MSYKRRVTSSPGDLVIGGSSGVDQRLAAGSDGQLLVVASGQPAWASTLGAAGLPSNVLRWQGTWGNSTAYVAGDLVAYTNQLWVCGSANSGITPATSSVYAANVLSDTPTAYYRLGDAPGATSALDSSGNGNTGLIEATVTFGASGLLSGDSSTAAQVSNATGAVAFPTKIQPGLDSTSYTHEFWVKGTGGGLLAANSGNPGPADWYSLTDIFWMDGGTGRFFYIGSQCSTTNYADNNPHHVVLVVTITGLAGNPQIASTSTVVYVDGVNLGTFTGGIYAGADQGASGVYWVYGNNFARGRFVGTIDEISYYRGVLLTAARVSAHYNAGHGANPWTVLPINPMTGTGDMIYGGASGAPTRLPAGTSSQFVAGGATPAFRALGAADIPVLDASKITTGTLALARGGTATDNSSVSANVVWAGPGTGAAASASYRGLVSADLPSAPTVSGEVTASDFKLTGLTGATAASRYVGATASGAPASGTFVVGDVVIDRTGTVWICTVAGSPGTWTQVVAGSVAAANVTGSHTLPDGVLSTNVPLKTGTNAFTGNQIFEPSTTSNNAQQTYFTVQPTYTLSGTAGYTALQVLVTENSLGSGPNYLLDVQVGGVRKFSVDRTGTLSTGIINPSSLTGSGTVPIAGLPLNGSPSSPLAVVGVDSSRIADLSGSGTAASATAGPNGATPAQVAGYLQMYVTYNSVRTLVRVPFYLP